MTVHSLAGTINVNVTDWKSHAGPPQPCRHPVHQVWTEAVPDRCLRTQAPLRSNYKTHRLVWTYDGDGDTAATFKRITENQPWRSTISSFAQLCGEIKGEAPSVILLDSGCKGRMKDFGILWGLNLRRHHTMAGTFWREYLNDININVLYST